MASIDQNITVDPRTPATPVDDPEITEVIDLVDGEILNAREYIGSHRYDGLIEARVGMREALKQRKPRHICALCGTPVYLVSNLHKRFFFRHTVEDGSCQAKTRSGLTEDEIRARKYHGLRESEAHKRIKRLIERSLRADPEFVIASILAEKRWHSAHDPKLWRQPDVQAVSIVGKFAFEAQLSTTFLDVVVSRRLFYQAENASLVWVLARFLPDYRRLTTDDLLFSNNSNIFVVDDETVLISEEKKRFHLRCFHRRPFREGDAISETWEEALVPFGDLVREPDRQRIYYFDYEREERRIKDVLDQELRNEVIDFWLSGMNPHFDGTPDSFARWQEIQRKLAAHGVRVPDNPSGNASFRSMIHGVMSAMRGQPVGWQFKTLIQVAHQLVQVHQENLLAFGYALEVSGYRTLIESQDVSGKWKRKCKTFRPLMRARDPAFVPPIEWLPALSFLFPEVGARVRAFLARSIQT
jgi:hypothetical protein